MLKPIGAYNISLCFGNFSNENNNDYVDPMMKWPLRGAAFTNEVGEALRPIIGNYANLTWAPALMYIGADIYDKYKNDRTEYNPDSKRGLKQTIFQGFASICLPVIAVKVGQKLFAQFGKLTSDKLSYNTKELISTTAEHFIANGKMRAYDGRDAECINEFLTLVTDSLDYHTKKRSLHNTFRIFETDKKENVKRYSAKTIKNLIQLRKDLLKPTPSFQETNWYLEYADALKSGQTENVAVKSVLMNFQKGKMLKGNFVKTIGGFAAFALAIKPIDNFVENVLIGKYVGPQIDKIKTNK